PARHHRADAANPRRVDEARPLGRRRRRDQELGRAQAMKLPVYNLKRESVGEIDLSDEVFGAEVKEHLFYEVVKAQLASRRAAPSAPRERPAVSGSTKMPSRQKGPGRARQGSIRAPHHSGGGTAHALEPKDWSYRPPRKVRIGALKSALSLFAKEGRLL